MAFTIGIVHPWPRGDNFAFPSFHSTHKSNTNPLLFHHRRRPHPTNCNYKALNPHWLLPAPPNSSIIHHHPPGPGPGPRPSSRSPHKKIDSWLQDSIPDIVTNLKHAPLLVQIHSDNNSNSPHGGGSARIQTEKAVLERWLLKKDQWKNGELKSPDGLIYVDELGPDNDDGGTKAWGVVVQCKGAGADCEHACYLLKTDRVKGGNGLGFCTHFCLMRVNNFWETALEQFQDSWLLQ